MAWQEIVIGFGAGQGANLVRLLGGAGVRRGRHYLIVKEEKANDPACRHLKDWQIEQFA